MSDAASEPVRVYVLDVGWENFWLEGVFSSAEAAMAANPESIQWTRMDYPGEEVWEGEAKQGPARITGYTIDRWESR